MLEWDDKRKPTNTWTTKLKTHAPINNRFQLVLIYIFYILSSYLFVLLLLIRTIYSTFYILFQYDDDSFFFTLFRFLSKVSLVHKLSNCLRKTVFSFIAKSNGIRVKKYTWNHEPIHTHMQFFFFLPPPLLYPTSHVPTCICLSCLFVLCLLLLPPSSVLVWICVSEIDTHWPKMKSSPIFPSLFIRLHFFLILVT